MSARDSGTSAPDAPWLRPADMWQSPEEENPLFAESRNWSCLLSSMFAGALMGAACALWFLS